MTAGVVILVLREQGSDLDGEQRDKQLVPPQNAVLCTGHGCSWGQTYALQLLYMTSSEHTSASSGLLREACNSQNSHTWLPSQYLCSVHGDSVL